MGPDETYRVVSSSGGSWVRTVSPLISLALLAVVPLVAGACGGFEPGSISLESPTSYDLGGMSEAERGQTLADLSRTSRATVYYPGDPSLGMKMAHIDKDFLSGTGPRALVIRYGGQTPERHMTVTVYTPEQFEEYSQLGSGASPPVALTGGSGDAIYELGGGGLPQTTLVAQRPGAVVVVSGNPDMTVSELTEVAAALRAVDE